MEISFKKDPERPSRREQPAPAKAQRGGKRPAPKRKGPVGSGRGQKFALIIGDEGAILIFMQKNKVIRRLFAPSPQPSHSEAMAELMRSNPNVPVMILMDVLDQQYVRQSFPPVSSLSVNGLVQRRLARDFQADDLKGSLPLGRDRSGRKEWNFLLIALAKTPLISEWLDLIIELPNQMKGVYLVPVEASIYLASLRKGLTKTKPLPWQLLVSHNKVSGFRQVVFRDGKLAFTRVTQAIDDVVPAVIAGNIEQEITSTIEYLRRLGFQDNTTLEAFVVASQDVADVLDLKRFNFGIAHAMTPLEVSDALKFEQAALSADRFGDVVMTAAFMKAPKRVLRFTTAYAERLAKLYLIKKGIAAFAVIGLLALVGLTIQTGLAVFENSDKVDQIAAERSKLQSKMATLEQTVANLNKDVAYKSAIVGTYDAYFKNKSSALDFIRDLAPFINSERRVTSLLWERQAPATGTGPNAVKGPNSSLKAEFEFKFAFSDAQSLTKAMDTFIAELKSKLPQYEVLPDTYPWLSEAKAKQEISFDQQRAGALKDGWNKLNIRFVGPKPVDANAKKPKAGTP